MNSGSPVASEAVKRLLGEARCGRAFYGNRSLPRAGSLELASIMRHTARRHISDGLYKTNFLENAVFGRSSQSKSSLSTPMNKGEKLGRDRYAPAQGSKSSLGIIGGQSDGHREGIHPIAPS
jgi:hypothetical protein